MERVREGHKFSAGLESSVATPGSASFNLRAWREHPHGGLEWLQQRCSFLHVQVGVQEYSQQSTPPSPVLLRLPHQTLLRVDHKVMRG